MIALAKYTQQHNAVPQSDLALTAKVVLPLPLVPEFWRESDVETLWGELAGVPNDGIITS